MDGFKFGTIYIKYLLLATTVEVDDGNSITRYLMAGYRHSPLSRLRRHGTPFLCSNMPCWSLVTTSSTAKPFADVHHLVLASQNYNGVSGYSSRSICFSQLPHYMKGRTCVLCRRHSRNRMQQRLIGHHDHYPPTTDWPNKSYITASRFNWIRGPRYNTWFYSSNWIRT